MTPRPQPQELRWGVPTEIFWFSLPGLLDLFNLPQVSPIFFDVIAARLRQVDLKIQIGEGLRSGNHPQLLPWGRGSQFKRLIGVFGGKHHIDHLAQQLPTPARGIKATRNL